jgi:hypothetical protein
MSGLQRTKIPTTATAADCGRLWTTLQKEYISDLRIEMRIFRSAADLTYLSLEVIDDSLETLEGSLLVNVWASKEFANPLYLITAGQLFDLLISAHAAIEAYFKNGTPSAPARRRR